jgi:predicted YcjX-like family ATPase
LPTGCRRSRNGRSVFISRTVHNLLSSFSGTILNITDSSNCPKLQAQRPGKVITIISQTPLISIKTWVTSQFVLHLLQCAERVVSTCMRAYLMTL